jgi:DNA invertase Pin-like site-specific DNA recombinase
MHKVIAMYVRVSTNQQQADSQLPDLQRYAAQHEGEFLWFTDKASGKTMKRPAWDRLHKAILAGAVNAVVVWRLDRLGRTAKGLTALFEELQERKINLVSIRDGLDLSTSSGRLMANVLASVAQYETEVRAERVAAGQAVARAKGISWGGSKAGKVIKTSATPEQISTMWRLHKEGEKIVRIARATGLSRQTIYRYLDRANKPAN